ncbi:hypothetical protein [Streptomyces sp. NBC_00320]|uniref:GNAT family N-acetyltransferase n=1 Tax=Streptomyces sp. NBC_00320 TaxID=2975711 RepID=UPI002B1E8ED3|nr:hypothetical protein [Streptomyces sp. NBC_00320]
MVLARSAGRLVGVAATLARHPDPASGDPDPWIGLLLIDATLVEDRFRAAGRTGVRLAVLDNNPAGLAFWRSRGYTALRRAQDHEHGRDCTVLRKAL